MIPERVVTQAEMSAIEADVLKYCEDNVNEVKDCSNKQKKKIWDRFSVVVSCSNGQAIKHSHSQKNSSFEKHLEMKLSSIGTIGEKRYTRCGLLICPNIIGSCAEPNAANLLLKATGSTMIDDIVFSNAYRPRCVLKGKTNAIIPPCQNCKDTFITL